MKPRPPLSPATQAKVDEGGFEVVVLYRSGANGKFYALTLWREDRRQGGFFEGLTADEAVEQAMERVWAGL